MPGMKPDSRYPYAVAYVSMIKQGWSYSDIERLTDSQFWLFQRAHLHMNRLQRQADKRK